MAMTSRERVRAVIQRKIPDRVPMDLWGTDSRMLTDYYKMAAERLGFQELGQRIRPGSTSEYEDYRIADIVGEVIEYPTINDALQAVRTGEADAILQVDMAIMDNFRINFVKGS